MISLRTPDGDAEIGTVSVLTPDGDKLIGRISVLTPDGDAVIYDSSGGGGGGSGELAVTIDPPVAVGAIVSSVSAPVLTGEAAATVTGGTAPYTYAWALDSGSVGWTAPSLTSSTTRFRFSSLDPGTSEFATFELTVTDDRGRTATATVDAQVYNYGSA